MQLKPTISGYLFYGKIMRRGTFDKDGGVFGDLGLGEALLHGQCAQRDERV